MAARVVALGASNLTRGFHALTSASAARWGSDVDVYAALGHGRSYGAPSRFLFRTLPGILQCGIWAALEDARPAPTRALITDVGNDILYGFPADRILAWVETCVERLRRIDSEVTLTDLPLSSIRRLPSWKFLIFRSALVPRCRLSLGRVLKVAEEVNEGLEEIARAHRVRFFRLRPEWYGFDPIHVRPRLWREAWEAVLLGDGEPPLAARVSMLEAIRLYALPPERRIAFGIDRVVPQGGVPLRSGGCVRLY